LDNVTAVFVAFLAAALPLAVLVTKVVDTARNLFDGDDSAPKWVWNVLALAAGVALCLGWGFNLVDALAKAIPALADNSWSAGVGGQILTGLAIGAMAGFWHEKMDQWSTTATANRAALPTARQS